MKKLMLTIIITIITINLFSCTKPVEELGEEEWLFMMYVGGDNDLNNELWTDINEMEQGIYRLNKAMRKKLKIVVLWDGISSFPPYAPAETKLYELGSDKKMDMYISSDTKDLTESDKWWSGDEIDTSNATNIKKFLEWATDKYPSYKNRALIISDHGGGPRSREANQTRGAVWDDTTGRDSYLKTKEITKAITDAGFTEENKLSILGFDACLMASVEEAYEHRKVANYYIASINTEQCWGWEYNHWIPEVNSYTTPQDLGKLVVDSYRANFNKGNGENQTLSLINMENVENLKHVIDKLAGHILSSDKLNDYKGAFERSQSFTGNWAQLHEIGDFVNELSLVTDTTTEEISTVIEELDNAMKKAIAYSWADSLSGNYYGDGSNTGKGLSLMGSQNGYPINFNYDETILDFANGDWGELWNKWYNQQ